MKCKEKPYYACHQTIYSYIYTERAGKDWYQYLSKAKLKPGKRRGRKHGGGKFKDIRPITQPPIHVATRSQIGHWEGDTVRFTSSKYASITTLVERKSRYLVMLKNKNNQSGTVMSSIMAQIKRNKVKVWRSITFDQGSEFAHFKPLEEATCCITYYCSPRSPWQRGSNENMNGRLRSYLPLCLPVAGLEQGELAILASNFNRTPRKILGYRTPKEVFDTG